MIHEKLKATNSNEFIIEDMDEISKFFFYYERRRKEEKNVINKKHEMKTFLNP